MCIVAGPLAAANRQLSLCLGLALISSMPMIGQPL
jgi:hypothetical protein